MALDNILSCVYSFRPRTMIDAQIQNLKIRLGEHLYRTYSALYTIQEQN